MLVEILSTSEAAAGRIWVDEASPDVLRMSGEVDLPIVEALEVQLGTEHRHAGAPLAEQGVRSIEMGGVTFIDSSTLGLIVGLAIALQPERLRLAAVPAGAEQVLTVTGVNQLVDLA
jgi:anti-anti-sigma factor